MVCVGTVVAVLHYNGKTKTIEPTTKTQLKTRSTNEAFNETHFITPSKQQQNPMRTDRRRSGRPSTNFSTRTHSNERARTRRPTWCTEICYFPANEDYDPFGNRLNTLEHCLR